MVEGVEKGSREQWDVNLQAIQKGNSQLTQDIIALLNGAVAATGTGPLQWIPTYVDMFGNEQNDNLAKEARNSLQLSRSLTFNDANAISRRKLTIHPVMKHFILYLNCNRVISP
ncbi:hypothetical protein TNCV_2581811 [Trichonephila clavipes]|nr:hypothetical protein TNCV_2581811 [Trichonephila clavipes]